MDSAILKLYLSESFAKTTMDAVRIFGGKGYLAEVGLERQLRDSVGSVIYAGTSDIQKNIISGMLGI